MNRSKTTVLTLALGALLMTGCVSKKNLESCQAELKNCQTENRELTGSYQNTKEQLAAAQARVASLSDQLAEQQKAYKALQQSLDKSLANTSANSVNISKLVDQINESNQYIRHLVEVKSKSDSLNMVLTNNLTRSLSKEELKAAGLNDSNTHVDFMVGTADLSIIGTTKDGREIPVFVNGNFAL